MIYGDYAEPNPPSAIINAVARGDIDVAIAWGPLAGYFASREPVALTLEPVSPSLDGPQWPMVFDISMGVRRTDSDFRRRIDALLEKEKPAIDAILARYHVPRVADPADASN
jgi:mxaJ protein